MENNRQPGESRPMSGRERTLLFLLLVVYGLSGVFGHSLWGANDSREGAMVADMVRSGNWVVPTLNGEPYLEKPPLLHWTGALFCTIAGTVTEGLVRLPSALFALGALLLVWNMGRRLGYERGGCAGAFICATSLQYFEYSRIVLTDACLTFMVTLSLWLFWLAFEKKNFTAWAFAPFLLVSAAAFYAKGLLGPGFVWVTVVAFFFYRRHWRLAVCLALAWLPIFIAAIAPWAWALYKAGGMNFIETVFWANQFGRFLTFADKTLPPDPYFYHKEPIYYYLLGLPVAFLPWTPVAIAAVAGWFRRRGGAAGGDLRVFLGFALVAMLVILHVSAAKVLCYTLPLFPIVGLMSGVWLEKRATTGFSAWERGALRLSLGGIAALFVLMPVLGIVLYFAPPSVTDRFTDSSGVNVLRITGTVPAAAALILCACLLAFVAYLILRVRREQAPESRARNLLLSPAMTAAALVVLMAAIYPVHDYQRSYRPFADMAKARVDAGYRLALALPEERHIGAFTFYIGNRLPVLVPGKAVGEYLASTNGPSAVIIRTGDMAGLADWGLPAGVAVQKSPHHGYKAESFRLLVHAVPD